MTSAECPPGVADSIEKHNGRQVTRRATSKGSWGGCAALPEYGQQCKKSCPNGHVASDGDRCTATVSDEEG